MDASPPPSGTDDLKPFGGAQPVDMLPEIFIADAFAEVDERLWVPLAPGRWSRPLCLNASQGYWVHLLRVRGGGFLSRHRHPGPVHGLVIKGSWRYLEHDWVAKAGSYVFEPPGEIHTLVVDDDCDEMITLFHNTGAVLYCDEDGVTTGATDVFDRIKATRAHFEAVGLGADFAKQFIR